MKIEFENSKKKEFFVLSTAHQNGLDKSLYRHMWNLCGKH